MFTTKWNRVLLACVLLATGFGLGGCRGITDSRARQVLQDRVGETSFTVFPAFVRQGKVNRYDAESSEAIGRFLREKKLGTVVMSGQEVPITGGWHMNQARMLRESAAAFKTFLDSHPVETDYALLPEYIGGPTEVGGVHCYVMDREGKVAWVLLVNSHHDVFTNVNPQSPEDCAKVVNECLRLDLILTSDM